MKFFLVTLSMWISLSANANHVIDRIHNLSRGATGSIGKIESPGAIGKAVWTYIDEKQFNEFQSETQQRVTSFQKTLFADASKAVQAAQSLKDIVRMPGRVQSFEATCVESMTEMELVATNLFKAKSTTFRRYSATLVIETGKEHAWPQHISGAPDSYQTFAYFRTSSGRWADNRPIHAGTRSSLGFYFEQNRDETNGRLEMDLRTSQYFTIRPIGPSNDLAFSNRWTESGTSGGTPYLRHFTVNCR